MHVYKWYFLTVFVGLLYGQQTFRLRYIGTPPSFSAMFSKEDNFRDILFHYLEDKIFPNWGLLKNTFFSLYDKGGLHIHLQETHPFPIPSIKGFSYLAGPRSAIGRAPDS